MTDQTARSVRVALTALALLVPTTAFAAATPQSVVDELLAADRAFSAASAKTDLLSGLSAMFADDVIIRRQLVELGAGPGDRRVERRPRRQLSG